MTIAMLLANTLKNARALLRGVVSEPGLARTRFEVGRRSVRLPGGGPGATACALGPDETP